MNKNEYKEKLKKSIVLSEILPKLSERAASEVQLLKDDIDVELKDYESKHGYEVRPTMEHLSYVYQKSSKVPVVIITVLLVLLCMITATIPVSIIMLGNAFITYNDYGSDYDTYLENISGYQDAFDNYAHENNDTASTVMEEEGEE